MASADGDAITPERRFAESLQQDVVYMGLSHSSQLTGSTARDDYTEPRGTVLMIKVAASCFITTDGTWAGVTPHSDAEENVSLALWMCEMARRCKIDVRIETLLNEESAQSQLARIVCYRIWLNVPDHKRLDFAKTCLGHLTGIDTEEDEEEKKNGKEKRGRKRKRKTKRIEKHGVTFERVDNQSTLKRIVNRMYMCSRDSDIRTLNWDAIVEDGEATSVEPADDVDASQPEQNGVSTLFTLLSAERHFTHTSVQQEYTDAGVPAYAKRYESYVGNGLFRVPNECYAHFPWTFRNVVHQEQCFEPNADQIKEYLLPNNDVDLKVLAKRFANGVQRFNGASRKRRYTTMSAAEIKALFVGNDAPHKNYSRTIEIKVPHPVGQLKGVKYNDQQMAMLYPVGFKKCQENREAQKRVFDQVKRRRLSEDHLKRIHESVADDCEGLLSAVCLGTVPTYKCIAEDFFRLHEIVHDNTEEAKRQRKFVYYNPSPATHIPLLDSGLMSIMDGVTNFNNCTQTQVFVVVFCIIMMFGSAFNVFGQTMMALALTGRSDVGKSFAVRVVTGLLPPSMQEAENDTSEKAWVLDGAMPFRFCWKDEAQVGVVDAKGRSVGKDSKIAQAGMCNGSATYKQYRKGKEGTAHPEDWLAKMHVDMRNVPCATTNNGWNEAMGSRYFTLPAFEEKKNARGRTKTEKAACDVQNSEAADNFQVFMQYFMSASFWSWHIRSNGAFVTRLDTTMYEVMTGLQMQIFPQATKCRDQDRVKQLGRSLMNFKAMNELTRIEANQEVLLDPMRRDAFLKVRCAVVPARCFEIGLQLTRPSKAFAAGTTRVKIAIKKLISHDFMTMEPIVDRSGHYYVTDVTKQDATTKLYNSCESQNLETNADQLADAMQSLECTSIEGITCLKFEGSFEKLHILKSVIDCAGNGIDSVLTEGEVSMIEFMIHVKENSPEGVLWRYSYNEKNILFDTCVRDLLTGEEAIFGSSSRVDQRPVQLKKMRDKLALNLDVRKISYLWLTRNIVETIDGNPSVVFNVVSQNEASHEGMMVLGTDANPGLLNMAANTNANGPHPNKKKRPVLMPGSIAMSRQFLKDFLCPADRADAEEEKLHVLSDVLMAVTGEAKVGDVLFRGVNTEADTDVASAVTTTVREPPKNVWTYDNPRRYAKNNVETQGNNGLQYDTLHPENQKRVTLRKGERLYQRRCEEACVANTGMSLQKWEAMWDLPPMFPGENFIMT